MSATTVVNDGKAVTTRTTFSRTTAVATGIKADPSVVWALLTSASDYPSGTPPSFQLRVR